jgi:hypothetical protein
MSRAGTKMTSDMHDAAVRLGPSAGITDRSRNLGRWWSVITSLIVLAVFMEAVFAGAMLSGVGWAHTAHAANAALLIAATITAGLVSVATLRRVPDGSKLGLTLLSLATGVCLQAALGALSEKGANLLWLHVPLGVALLGFATQAAARARRLRGQ